MNNLFGLVGKLKSINMNNLESTITIEVDKELFEIIIPSNIKEGFKRYQENDTIILASGYIKNKDNKYILIANKISYVSEKIKRD